VCTLRDFLDCATDEQLTKTGGSALLPSSVSKLFSGDLQRLRRVTDIPEVPLSEVDEWNDMVRMLCMGTAGLAQYLMDSWPEDLDYFWLE
jgi:hypothetical protein